MTTVLAADLGGTTTKAALVASDGTVRAEASMPAPPADADGLIAPSGWWDGFVDAAAALHRMDRAAFASIAAIAVTGVTRTPVVLDAAGEPLVGAMPARDARAQEIAAQSAIDPRDCAEAAHYDGFHPAARLQWLGLHTPDVLANAVAVVDPKDFVAARLTGRIASDSISLARLIASADGSRGPSLLARLGLPDLVPDLVAPANVTGFARGSLPAPLGSLAGRPVVMCAHDTWAGVLGLGALTPGRAYNVSGTTETFGVMTTRPVKADGLIGVQWGKTLHQIGGPGQNGADVLTWLGGLLGGSGSEAAAQRTVDMEAALSLPRHPAPLLFLPFLSGERVPFWDADLRAAFLGLSREHGPADLAWAVLEGIAFLNRIVLGRAEAAAGIAVDEIRLGGGAARSARWAQVKADVLERPVATVGAEETGVFGAALAAFVALNTFDTLDHAQQLVRVARRFAPRPRTRDFYRALGLLFDDTHNAVRPVSHRLTKLTVPNA